MKVIRIPGPTLSVANPANHQQPCRSGSHRRSALEHQSLPLLPRPNWVLARLRGLEGGTLRNPLEINAATSKVGTTNLLAGVHDLGRKSWEVVALATPV